MIKNLVYDYYGINPYIASDAAIKKADTLAKKIRTLIVAGGLVFCLGAFVGSQISKNFPPIETRKAKLEQPSKTSEITFPKLVHEYLDLNENGLYNTHKLVYEYPDGRRKVNDVEYYGKDYTEEYIRNNFLPQGNEVRFLKK